MKMQTDTRTNTILLTSVRWTIFAFFCVGVGFWRLAEGPEHWNEWVGWIMIVAIGFLYALLSTQDWSSFLQNIQKDLKSQGLDSLTLFTFTLNTVDFFIHLLILVATIFIWDFIGIGMMLVVVLADLLILTSTYAKHREIFEKNDPETFGKGEEEEESKSDKDGD